MVFTSLISADSASLFLHWGAPDCTIRFEALFVAIQ